MRSDRAAARRTRRRARARFVRPRHGGESRRRARGRRTLQGGGLPADEALFAARSADGAAVIDAAHAAGMTVTGHIPGGLTMREVVEMGMDHIAHLTVRDAPGSDALRDTIAFLKTARHGHRSDAVVERAARPQRHRRRSRRSSRASSTWRRRSGGMLDGANGGNVTPEQARERLSRSLQIVKALHDAGSARSSPAPTRAFPASASRARSSSTSRRA